MHFNMEKFQIQRYLTLVWILKTNLEVEFFILKKRNVVILANQSA